ncbi:helix-turn-helix protein [Mycoplasma testudineum]|uniref:Helix-turn-helix protein n=1 Tax=Mycoplasma testudineum TaxID=244584 RepID=A0A4R6IH93_9MOLU|nr:helix-turn-helix domain-containing protein [Mycoplasma testudineum]OYD26643.1 hypothetical protein CG473_02470 [Mycoplasma testudineum]TDO21228.1 helix-turn-helix protein [Mycoplasma testudineum]
MNYSHIYYSDRLKIELMFNQLKLSIRKIAEKLKISSSSVSRELKRNTNEYGFYLAKDAEKIAVEKSQVKSISYFSKILKIYFDFSRKIW